MVSTSVSNRICNLILFTYLSQMDFKNKTNFIFYSLKIILNEYFLSDLDFYQRIFFKSDSGILLISFSFEFTFKGEK